MNTIETARLRLRPMVESDAAFLLEVLNEPAFIRNVGHRGVRTVPDAVTYMRERIITQYERHGFGMWLVELADTREPVGICGLIKRDSLKDIDLGFSFLERFWSRGFALEAARAALREGWEVLKLSRIVAIVAPHNDASIRLLSKLGFELEKKVRLAPEEQELLLLATEPPAKGKAAR